MHCDWRMGPGNVCRTVPRLAEWIVGPPAFTATGPLQTGNITVICSRGLQPTQLKFYQVMSEREKSWVWLVVVALGNSSYSREEHLSIS